MKRSTFYVYLVISSPALLVGCETPNRLDTEFGNSYRNMVAEQIYDPRAAANPPAEPPLVLDGQRASDVIEKYREGDDKGREAVDTLSIRVGR